MGRRSREEEKTERAKKVVEKKRRAAEGGRGAGTVAVLLRGEDDFRCRELKYVYVCSVQGGEGATRLLLVRVERDGRKWRELVGGRWWAGAEGVVPMNSGRVRWVDGRWRIGGTWHWVRDGEVESNPECI